MKLTERTIMLTTKAGFTEIFWQTLIEKRRENPFLTEADIYETLEDEYIGTFGRRRYSNFQSFRRRRDQ